MVSPPHGYIPGCYNDPKTPTPVSIGQRLLNGLVVSSRTHVCIILVSDRKFRILTYLATDVLLAFPRRLNASNVGLVSCTLAFSAVCIWTCARINLRFTCQQKFSAGPGPNPQYPDKALPFLI
jgi:hypothetical protein